jgi:ABC-type amino acid transport system permease subunit
MADMRTGLRGTAWLFYAIFVLEIPAWASPAAETYLFIAAIYFGLAFSFARFADFLERRANVATGSPIAL